LVQIIELLGNRKTFEIVLFFIESPEERSQTELINSIGLAKATAVRSLKLLVGSGILLVRKIGPTNLYSLNKESSLLFHISAMRELLK
jgi:DNA-binding MarR family transcriptional regulator